jgi:hypothetical protein
VFASSSFTTQSKLHLPKSSGINRTVPCQVNTCSSQRLQIAVAEPLAAGTAVSVEHEDALLLGEVVAGSPLPEGWQLDIKIVQALNGLMNLMALQAGLLGESNTSTPQHLRR